MRERQGRSLPQSLQRDQGPALAVRLLAPRTVREYTSAVLSHPLFSTLSLQPQKLIHRPG